MTLSKKADALPKKKRNYLAELYANRYLYLLMLPAIILYIIFNYIPMYGITIAFKDYNAGLGIMGSKWIGFDHFESLFTDSYFWYVLWNTIRINFGRVIFEFPVPVILAILFNELRGKKRKKILQTVYTFPHFISWIILSGIIINFLDFSGPLNALLDAMGFERVAFLGKEKAFVPILYISAIWKDAGYSSIIYLAAITGINSEFYEAAELDGATRLQKIWHITLPCIRGTILMLLTLYAGRILNDGFDQIFNLTNPVVMKAGDILDTYIYRITFQSGGDFAFSTALGLFKSLVNITLLLFVDYMSKKLEGVGVLS